MSSRTEAAPPSRSASLRRVELAKCALAGVLLLSVYFLPSGEGWWTLVPVAALLLVLLPPTDRRSTAIRVGIAGAALAALAMLLVASMPSEGFAMNGSLRLGTGPMLVGFLLLAALIGGPALGGLALLHRAWRIVRPPPTEADQRSARLRRAAQTRRSREKRNL